MFEFVWFKAAPLNVLMFQVDGGEWLEGTLDAGGSA